MPSACALGIFSGNNIYNFGTPERLRTLRCSLFTGRGRKGKWQLRIISAGSPSQSKPCGFASSPKGRALGSPRKLHLFAKASPFGRGGFAQQRRRGRGCFPLDPLSHRCAMPAPPKGGAFCHLPVGTNKAPPERKDFPRAGGRCRAATKGGIWRTNVSLRGFSSQYLPPWYLQSCGGLVRI